MPELRCLQNETRRAVYIPWERDKAIIIGSDSQHGVQLEAPGILPRHATIIKLPESPSYVILDHATPQGGVTKVNGLPVLKFKIIRHGDSITFGQQQFVFSEFQFEGIGAGSPHLAKVCSIVCPHEIKEDDEIVICRCGHPSHLHCWLLAERCPQYDCAYPHRNLLVRSLRNIFTFETLTASSPLIGKRCSNLSSDYGWDNVPFGADKKKMDRIAYCPGCKMPFHERCWLSFDVCPTPQCGYNVRKRVLEFFSPESSEWRKHGL
jgi:hypothetical protein